MGDLNGAPWLPPASALATPAVLGTCEVNQWIGALAGSLINQSASQFEGGRGEKEEGRERGREALYLNKMGGAHSTGSRPAIQSHRIKQKTGDSSGIGDAFMEHQN